MSCLFWSYSKQNIKNDISKLIYTGVTDYIWAETYDQLESDFSGIVLSFDYELGYWANILENLPAQIDDDEVEG